MRGRTPICLVGCCQLRLFLLFSFGLFSFGAVSFSSFFSGSYSLFSGYSSSGTVRVRVRYNLFSCNYRVSSSSVFSSSLVTARSESESSYNSE